MMIVLKGLKREGKHVNTTIYATLIKGDGTKFFT